MKNKICWNIENQDIERVDEQIWKGNRYIPRRNISNLEI